MRALITGADGFAGGHLVKTLQAADPSLELHGTVRFDVADYPHLQASLRSVTQVDLRDLSAVEALVADVKPDYIFHLAAQAFVPRSFEDPWETLENNIRSQLNVFLAVLNHELKPRILIVSSAEVYGIVEAEKMPITEGFPLAPVNPYSVSKVTQDMLGLQYHLSHELPVIRVRPFNHIGPGQHPNFVAPAFATQIARIELGAQEPVLRVGALSAKRDFTDVRDVTAAYYAAITKGKPGAVYNVSSGRAYSIQYLLDTLLSYSTVSVQVVVDPDRLRVVDRPLVYGSAALLQADTGWQPSITFEESLRDVLDEARERVRQEQGRR
jgi:GDP-4-dehydro-6-deoxy-D-mannose reductase